VWDDPDHAQKLNKEFSDLDRSVSAQRSVIEGISDAAELLELALEENDQDTLESVAEDLQTMERQVAELEFRRMFSGEMDDRPCFIDIQAGSGGTEAQDWAGILLRMYLKWAEHRGWK